MGSRYVYNENILRDVMVIGSLNSIGINDVDLHKEMLDRCINLIGDAYDAVNVTGFEKYIDIEFDIDKDQKYVKVVCNNIISALWFSGIFPIDFTEILLGNKFKSPENYYTFDKKRKKLIIKSMKINE